MKSTLRAVAKDNHYKDLSNLLNWALPTCLVDSAQPTF